MESDNYKTIKSSSRGTYKEKGSRFIALASPVADPGEAMAIIEDVRKEYHDARHHCYAYMIGIERSIWRVNDDGEPSGSAGRPILGQINSRGLTNILVVVSRYFGGTLLGVSGLINAYRTAASEAIDNAGVVGRTLHEYYQVKFPYVSMNDVMKILKEENAVQSGQSSDLECSVLVNFRVMSKERILSRLSRIEGLKYSYLGTK
jgi:uncharacterized YigZ family protein